MKNNVVLGVEAVLLSTSATQLLDLHNCSAIFAQFLLAESTRIIHHNQLVITKFGRILCLTRK